MEAYGATAIGQLSGGQQQKVLLCRAIIANPELLILDEPNTYVDNKFEGELYEMLKELNERMAIVMVSHDIGTITSYVKSIACVNRSLHHHHSNRITETQLAAYDCPIQLITHGRVPHTVLEKHE
jgi:zinc transport system ATP-binding protein